MKNFQIKITGAGSIDQIRQALRNLSLSLADTGVEESMRLFEDETLLAELTEAGEVDQTLLPDRRFKAWLTSSKETIASWFTSDDYPVVDITTFIGLQQFLQFHLSSVDHEIKYLKQMNIGEQLAIDYNPDFIIERTI